MGLGGVALVGVGAALGRGVDNVLRPDAIAVQDAAANDLGAEYMELVARAANAERSGDLQLLLAPFNSANYSFESDEPAPARPAHLARRGVDVPRADPLVAYGPGIIEPGDNEDRVSLADLAPTTAGLIGFNDWPGDREGKGLPGFRTTGKTPKVVVTRIFRCPSGGRPSSPSRSLLPSPSRPSLSLLGRPVLPARCACYARDSAAADASDRRG